jgi:hypothetical protein
MRVLALWFIAFAWGTKALPFSPFSFSILARMFFSSSGIFSIKGGSFVQFRRNKKTGWRKLN